MNILGDKVINRTENWKTAQYFSPFFWDEGARLRLAKEILVRHGIQLSKIQIEPDEVSISLFWYGMRDYLCPEGTKEGYYERARQCYKKPFTECYNRLSSDFHTKLHKNYSVLNGDNDRMDTLFRNVFYTEIDIVLESQDHLFIGEAKHEQPLGANGEYVLVHQLIRQYVMARILIDHIDHKNKGKEIVPFVVVDKKKSERFKRTKQVKYMTSKIDEKTDRGWMSEKNVLTWDYIEKELWPKPWPPGT